LERTTVNRRYRVDRRIGDGGMAEVYLGHDLLLNRAVALKAMRPQYAADPVFRARFEREAVAVAGLTHPNIVDIFDVGEEGGTPYLVMEFVRGDTLKTVIEAEGPFAPDDVAALLEQVGSALDFAHERGIVHRDVKPQNVLVAPDGVVKVVDFGIAKGVHDSHLTELGTGLGTVHYISPEQANGLMATPSSDVYSLGVVAYEMLTGRLPFEADSPVAVAMHHLHDRPRPPSAVFSPVPRPVDAIVLRALEKDPTRRFRSAGAFAEAMTDWRQQAVVAYPGGWPASPVALPGPMRTEKGRGGEEEQRRSPPLLSPSPPLRLSPAKDPTPAPRRQGRASAEVIRDDVGCTTWLTGSLVLIALVALIWLGFRLSPRLAELSEANDAPTAVAATGGAGALGGGLPRPTEPVEHLQGPSPTATSAGETLAQGQSRSVAVPDLIGKSLIEATELVNARGLLIDDREKVFSEWVPPDAVAEQDPPANAQVMQGTTIVIKLSRGSATVALDELGLIGIGAEEAEFRLEAEGLGATRVEVGDPEMPKGRVVMVEPATTATVGEEVTLYVSIGDMIQVPAEIQGRPLADVERQLERLGLEVVETQPLEREAIESAGLDLEAARVEPGDVVGYNDEDGEARFGDWLPVGTEITLYYYEPNPEASEREDSG
jgi:serine/threonine-protein kinase